MKLAFTDMMQLACILRVYFYYCYCVLLCLYTDHTHHALLQNKPNLRKYHYSSCTRQTAGCVVLQVQTASCEWVWLVFRFGESVLLDRLGQSL
jgi:hypothetical protein